MTVFVVFMLLGNTFYIIGKPVYFYINGVIFVRKRHLWRVMIWDDYVDCAHDKFARASQSITKKNQPAYFANDSYLVLFIESQD